MNLQVCLRGQYNGSQTRSFTAKVTANGTTHTLGTFSGTRNCTGYAGNGSYPWTNFAIPAYGTAYLVLNITNSTIIKFLQTYGSSATYSLSSSSKFYYQIDLIIDKYEYTDPPKVTMTYPKSGKTTYNTQPRIAVTATSSSSITRYRYSFNNSTWTNLSTSITGTSATFQTSPQSTGSKTIYVQAYNGEWSGSAQQSFTIGTTSLGATEGALIDDVYIDNAQSYITNLAAYYGNTAPSWTTCNAGTKLNASQISELNTRLKALTPAQSFIVPTAGTLVDNALFSTTINNAIKDS